MGVCWGGDSSVQVFLRLTAPGRPPRYMPDWEPAAELKQDVTQPLKPGQTVETKVGGLKHRAEYQFRVIAVNKAGNSPESEATDYHLVKHRARECPPHWATFPGPHASPYTPQTHFHHPPPPMCHWGPISPVSLCFLILPMFSWPLFVGEATCYQPFMFHGPYLFIYGLICYLGLICLSDRHLFAWIHVLLACCMLSQLLHVSAADVRLLSICCLAV